MEKPQIPWWENPNWFNETLRIIQSKGFEILTELKNEDFEKKTS
jgi:hypothetical protein